MDYIFIVFNDNCFIENETQTYTLFEERKLQIEIALKKENISENNLKKIVFLVCPKYKDYAQEIIKGHTLCELTEIDLFSDNPIKYLGEFGSSKMRIVNPGTFYNLIYNK